MRRFYDGALLGSIVDELGVVKLILKIGGGEMNIFRVIFYLEYLVNISFYSILKKWKLEMVDDVLLGVVYLGKTVGYVYS